MKNPAGNIVCLLLYVHILYIFKDTVYSIKDIYLVSCMLSPLQVTGYTARMAANTMFLPVKEIQPFLRTGIMILSTNFPLPEDNSIGGFISNK